MKKYTYLLPLLLAWGCHKSDQSRILATCSNKAQGTKSWHGISAGSTFTYDTAAKYYVSHDYQNTITDTLTITRLDDATLLIRGKVLKNDSINVGAAYARYAYFNPNYPSITTYLNCYANGDSMKYISEVNGGHGGSSYLELHYP